MAGDEKTGQDVIADESRATSGQKRWVRAVLVISLGLNLLVIGAVGSAFLFRDGPPRHAREGERAIAAPYIGAFERADKREMRREMRKRLAGHKQTRAANAKDYAEFLSVLRADPYDDKEAKRILERQMARTLDIQKVGREIALQRIGAMTAQERAAYALRVEEVLQRGRPLTRGAKPGE